MKVFVTILCRDFWLVSTCPRGHILRMIIKVLPHILVEQWEVFQKESIDVLNLQPRKEYFRSCHLLKSCKNILNPNL